MSLTTLMTPHVHVLSQKMHAKFSVDTFNKQTKIELAFDNFMSMSMSKHREQWLMRVPNVQHGDPWYAFRSVSHRWVDQNEQSRENVMRSCLQNILGKTFIKVRPDFLRNPKTRRCLELDAYCESLRLGVEFHGIQHYQFPNPFHSTRAQFEAQCQRDLLKVELCKRHNVTLITVPHHVCRQELDQYLRLELRAIGYAYTMSRDRDDSDMLSAPAEHVSESGVQTEEELDQVLLELANIIISD